MSWAERDFERTEMEREKWLESRPVCDKCGEPIQDDHMYFVYPHQYCPECFLELADELKVDID